MALTVLVLAFQEASGWRASRFPTVQRPPVAAMMAFDLTPKPVPGERRAAVERILEVELARLRSAFDLNWERLCASRPPFPPDLAALAALAALARAPLTSHSRWRFSVFTG